MLDWLKEVYAGEELLIGVALLAGGALVLAAFASWMMKDTSVYGGICGVFGGTLGIVIAYGGTSRLACVVTVSALTSFGGLTYLLLFLTLSARRAVLARRRLRAEAERRIQYTLPERDNTFVRARLHTALRSDNAFNAYTGGENTQKRSVRLAYAKTLLSKAKEAPLTVAERLQIEEMEKILALYYDKKEWTAEELRSVNELCSSLLKISAKYAV
jgi:hypothetical protein